MAKNKPAVEANVTPFSEIQKLTQAETVLELVATCRSQQRAFVLTSKLLRHVEKTLKPTQTVGGLLKKYGIKKSTIDNARYAAKVFDLVEAGKITEAQFDTFTFADCLAIIRAMSAGSKKRLTADEVAAHVVADADFENDLHELFTTGLTAAEAKAAADLAAVAAKAKAKADAKAITDAEAQAVSAQAEADQLKAENAALLAQAAATPPAPEPPPVETVEVPAPGTETVVDVPTNIVPIASAPRKRTAADLVSALDSVFSDMAGLDADEQAVVGRKLIELADIIAETGSHLDAVQRIAA